MCVINKNHLDPKPRSGIVLEIDKDGRTVGSGLTDKPAITPRCSFGLISPSQSIAAMTKLNAEKPMKKRPTMSMGVVTAAVHRIPEEGVVLVSWRLPTGIRRTRTISGTHLRIPLLC